MSTPTAPPASATTLAIDLPLNRHFPVQPLLDAFAELAARRDDVKLLLSGKRQLDSDYHVINFIEQHQLGERIDYRPYYYNNCAPDLRQAGLLRLARATPASQLSADYLARLVDGRQAPLRSSHLLFVTAFHPLKQEGNSTAMRVWLDHLTQAGYTVHLLYYLEDSATVSDTLRGAARRQFDHYYEVPIANPLTGRNQPPLNVDVDDWCGPELLTAVEHICDRYEIRDCVVNYAFNSGVFQALPRYTRKIMLTHDRFADRNRNMAAQGFKDPAWVSLTRAGERIACQRADVVVALQHHEAAYFSELSGAGVTVAEVPPFFAKTYQPAHHYDGCLRIGYFGSHNSVNEQNLVQFIERWRDNSGLRDGSRLLIAGGVCAHLADFIDAADIAALGIELLGRFDQLDNFFAQCDVIINPERGGTGIKIKTLETLAHGSAMLSTAAGMVALPASQPCHQAANIEALVGCAAQLVESSDLPAALAELAEQSRQVYDQFHRHSHQRLSRLLPPLDPQLTISDRDRVSIIIRASADVAEAADPEAAPADRPANHLATCLATCLTSIAAQSYRPLDVIIVDDGAEASNGLDLADQPFPTQLIAHPQALGRAASLKQAVALASGRYLLFLDADSTLHANAVAALVDAAHQCGAAIAVGDSQPESALAGPTASPGGSPATAAVSAIDGHDAMLQSLGGGTDSETDTGSGPPLLAEGLLIERQLLLTAAPAFGNNNGNHSGAYPPDLTLLPLLYLLSGQVAQLEHPVRDRTSAAASKPESLPAAGTDYQRLWQTLDDRLQDLGLGTTVRADLATQLLSYLLAQAARERPANHAAERLYPLLLSLQALVDQAQATVQRSYARQLLTLMEGIDDRATYARLATLDQRGLLLDHYQAQLEVQLRTAAHEPPP